MPSLTFLDPASEIQFDPTGNIAATTVQGAIAELDSEALHTTGNESASGIKIFTDTTESTNSTTGAFQCRGGGAFAKNLYVGSQLILPSYSTFRVSKNNTLQTQTTDNTVVTWNTEEFDDDGVFGSNTFTANATGKFVFSGAVLILNNDASVRPLGVVMRVNTSSKLIRVGQAIVSASSSNLFAFSGVLLSLSIGDTVDVIARNFGNGFSYSIGNSTVGAETNYFSGHRIR